jgi:hypothetical protein
LSKQVGWKWVAAELSEHGSLGVASAVDLYNTKRSHFLDVVTRLFYPAGEVLVGKQDDNKTRCELFRELPLLAVPYRAPGQDGARPMLWLPDVPCLSDAELEAHLKPVLQLKRMKDERASANAGAALTAADYRLLKDAMPSEISAITDALILKIGGPEAATELSIGAHRAATAAQRLDLLINTTLPAAQAEAHAAATALLAKRSGLADGDVTAALRAATTRQLRTAVEKQGLLRNQVYATKKSLIELAPDLIDVLTACAREGSNAAFKEHGETPVDRILLEQGMRGSGGQVLRMQTILNQVCRTARSGRRVCACGASHRLACLVRRRSLQYAASPSPLGPCTACWTRPTSRLSL